MIDWQIQLIIGEISNFRLTQWKLCHSFSAQSVCGMKFALQHIYLLSEKILNLISERFMRRNFMGLRMSS